MNARQAEEYLLGLELFGMRFGLDRMRKLMTVLGMPQRRFESIHVVGTNGKSSTARMTAAILERHGIATGTYTSPHLRSFRERIEVREEPVPAADFGGAVAVAAHAAGLVDRTLAPGDHVTQFEALTAAAYHELARRGVEVAVIEAGLGGRYDATNVIPSRVQVLTGVGLEHTRWLGPTIADVAREKLAVVRDHATVVAGELDFAVEEVLARIVRERDARRVRPLADLARVAPPAGAFQRRNFAAAAAAAAAFLDPAGSGQEVLDEPAVQRAAAQTRIPGRLEIVDRKPLTIHDGAHNPDGAEALAEALPELLATSESAETDASAEPGPPARPASPSRPAPVVGVLAVLEDKDAAGILRGLLPLCDRAVYTRCANPRSLSPATLESLAAKLAGPPAETVPAPRSAVQRARELAGPAGAVVATGSIYLVADLVRERSELRASSM